MANVLWTDFVGGLSLDTIGGSERIPVLESSTAMYVTMNSVKSYVIDQLAAAAAVTPTTGDALLMERAGSEGTFDLDALASYVVASAWSVASEADPATSADKFVVNRSGTIYELDIDTVAAYVNSATLDLSALTAGTPGSSDLVLYGSGSSPRKITLANFESQLWTDFATYVDGLSENTTVTATDKLYVIQAGTPKWVDPDALAAYFNVTTGDVSGPVATTEDYIPQWDSTNRQLKEGLSLGTLFDTANPLDTRLVTEQAIWELVVDEDTMSSDSATKIPTQQSVKAYVDAQSGYDGSIATLDIDGGTDIASDLGDTDLLIVDDGASGTNRKSALSRVWTYILAKIAAVTDVSSYGWVLDEDTLGSDSNTKVPTQQSVKAYVDNVAGVQNNLNATTNPTATDDTSGGYSVGSTWVNVSTDTAYICVDATATAAIWTSTTAAAAGWDGDINDTDFSTGSDIGADLASGDEIIIGDASDSSNPKRSEMSRVKTYTNKLETASYSSNQTLTAAECNGYIVYVSGAATITLPPIADGMSVTIITIGDVAVSIDPNASDLIYLDGTALDDGDKITNGSSAGDIAVLTYHSSSGWHASTNGWTDGGA